MAVSRSCPREWYAAPTCSYSPGWLPTPTPRIMRPRLSVWSVAACLATATARRRGSWITQEPRAARSVAVAATVRTTMHSRQGPCQKRWSQAHSAPAPAPSARRQSSASSTRGSPPAAAPSAGSAHGGTVCCTKVGRIRPIGPREAGGRTVGTLHGTPVPSGSGHRPAPRGALRAGPDGRRRRCTAWAPDTAEWVQRIGRSARAGARDRGKDDRQWTPTPTHSSRRRRTGTEPRLRRPTRSGVSGWPRSTRSSSSCARRCRPTVVTWP